MVIRLLSVEHGKWGLIRVTVVLDTVEETQ